MKSDRDGAQVQEQHAPNVDLANGHSVNPCTESERSRTSILNRLSLPSVGLGFSQRKALLAAGDLAMLGFAWAADLVARHWLSGGKADLMAHWGWFASLAAMWLVSTLCTGAYELRVAATAPRSQWVAVGCVLMTCALYFFTPFITPALPERRSVLLVLPGIGALGISLWRLAYAKLVAQPQFTRRCLVVGAGWAGRELVRVLTENPTKETDAGNHAGYGILGLIDDDPEKEGQCIGNIPVLGKSTDLVQLARQYRVDELILAITHISAIQPRLFQAILACRQAGVRVTNMTTVYELVTGRLPLEHAGGNLDVVTLLSTRGSARLFLATKRMLDIVVGLAMFLIALLLAPLLWLANRLTSPGPLFYTQNRVGKDGKVFHIVKFRSMVPDAEKHTGGAVWARQNDERITPVGRILRKTRLDEFPQCWNILKGEMSLVGPRPERPEFVELLSQKIPFYRLRHAVKPGITGWAQVRYRYVASVEDSLVKLQYDLGYIKHQSMFLDWQILLETIKVVLGFQGR